MVIAQCNTSYPELFIHVMARLFRRYHRDELVQTLYTRVNSVGNVFQRMYTCLCKIDRLLQLLATRHFVCRENSGSNKMIERGVIMLDSY